MKPLIAINMDIIAEESRRVRLNRTYLRAISRAGGTPLIIPPMVPPMTSAELRRFSKMASGFLFIGGRDYSSSLYGEESHPSTKPIYPDREALDIALMKVALSSRDRAGRPKPVLGICGGEQLLNIVLGGSLIQDIESARPGTGSIHLRPGERAKHPVRLIAGSQLSEIYGGGTVTGVASYHHQAVGRLAEPLSISGFSDDGLIEGIEHRSRPFTIGVQWHPEVDYDLNGRLFRAFIKRAREMTL